jgi:hypothetical protein
MSICVELRPATSIYVADIPGPKRLALGVAGMVLAMRTDQRSTSGALTQSLEEIRRGFGMAQDLSFATGDLVSVMCCQFQLHSGAY